MFVAHSGGGGRVVVAGFEVAAPPLGGGFLWWSAEFLSSGFTAKILDYHCLPLTNLVSYCKAPLKPVVVKGC